MTGASAECRTKYAYGDVRPLRRGSHYGGSAGHIIPEMAELEFQICHLVQSQQSVHRKSDYCITYLAVLSRELSEAKV